ncbi:MAG TPA: type VI secretion system ATPase TssH [Thermoanaerobaculia bacterium]|nr:type VI secretion system ATPase TssH [Thermoanaerobaculia bacterium]
MITTDVRSLLARANPHVTRNLEGAAGFTIARTHYEVTLEHLLLKLLEDGTGDLPRILRHFDVDAGAFQSRLLAALEDFRAGNSGRPVFSPLLLDSLERAFLVGAVEYGQDAIRSGTLLASALSTRGGSPLQSYLDLLGALSADELRRDFSSIVAGSAEDRPATGRFSAPRSGTTAAAAGPGTPGPESALAQFTLDFTAEARDGKVDPVYGRDDEIRQVIDILTRRRKNNPILVGEAGVGKTALVEGLALRIVAGDVPEPLRGVEIRGLDLGLLQAGAGVKGEFENRLKSVIAEIKESPTPIVTFIDEAHTLIGAGGSAGQSDAANLLKPALARGELRTIAATTWSEYKKYFEKDPALARRFQLVKVEEPAEERAATMLRGVKEKFEEAHGVRILDTAVLAAVRLSERFISGRQLPDKAVDLLDTSAARVRIGLTGRPASVEGLERRIQHAEIAVAAKRRDVEGGSVQDDGEIERLTAEIETLRGELATLQIRWETERRAVDEVRAARNGGSGKDEKDSKGGEAETQGEDEAGKEKEEAVTADPERLAKALAALAEVQGKQPLIPLEVTPDVVAAVVSDWTGIPAGKMLRDQARLALELESALAARVMGQNPGLGAIAQRLRAARAGLGNPATPQGVFLLVGPSGVGKTETALALADLLFGGERFLTTINMSEYMEAHTVSRLIGSPPGYVGFGEGGILTEAVRQRPYSVVLLDEVEKSHPDVMNLFYQVFDKGTLADGEGREIDFKNTVVIMTSNLGDEDIVAMCASPDVVPEPDELVEALRPRLRERFKPALLARMTIVPFVPLPPDVLRGIVDLKLNKIVRRMAGNARIDFSYTPAVADWIAGRCTVEETGARNIDHVIQSAVLTGVSTEILGRMAREEPIRSVRLDVGEAGDLVHVLE